MASEQTAESEADRPTGGKVDLRKTLDGYRAKRGQFRVLDVPDVQYLMADGCGDPDTSPLYPRTLAALYPVAYALKFLSKREHGRDYVVPPLEGLWWADDMDSFTIARDKSRWRWTMMLLVPGWLGQEAVATAVARVASQKRPVGLEQVRLETLAEGRCVQTLHVGPFDEEGPVLDRMHREFIPRNGLRLAGRHHEIYLSDPRRSAPERLRTILRQPVVTAVERKPRVGSR